MSLETDARLNPRAQHLLKTLVEQYIRDGNPVGSRTLSRDSGLELSAATVRNVMADLEELGLVISPHTSAGRVPTVQGYRLFVDTMLTVEPPADNEVAYVRAELGMDPGREQIVQRASSILSEYTRLAGMVMLPRRDEVTLRQVEFLPLSGNKVLVILVLNDRRRRESHYRDDARLHAVGTRAGRQLPECGFGRSRSVSGSVSTDRRARVGARDDGPHDAGDRRNCRQGVCANPGRRRLCHRWSNQPHELR